MIGAIIAGIVSRCVPRRPLSSLVSRGYRKGRFTLWRWHQRRTDHRQSTTLADLDFSSLLMRGVAPGGDLLSGSALFPGLDRLAHSQTLVGETSLDQLALIVPQIRSHRFNILGSGPVTIGYTTETTGILGHSYSMAPGETLENLHLEHMRARLEEEARFIGDKSSALTEMRQALTAGETGYKPIDWHLDFKSGYRWNPHTWYMEIPYAHLPGVDIKMPWELSRCHHLVNLALNGAARPPAVGDTQEIGLQLLDWTVANPVRFGVNWRSAMDVAIRAANWVWVLALMPRENLPPSLLWWIAKSLYQHARHIEAHLDYSPEVTNNHYLAEVVGLMYVAFACPRLPQSPRWLALCLQELVSEMGRTVYQDGVSHEASTGYQRLVTEMFLHGSLLALRLSPEDRQRVACCSVDDHQVSPRLQPAGQWEFSLDEEHIFPHWYWEQLACMVQYMTDVTKPNGMTPQWGDQDSGRFVKFSPVLKRCAASDDPLEEPRDHRHILAVGGVLFGRKDWVEAGNAHPIDALVLTSNVNRLPLEVTEGIPNSIEAGRESRPREQRNCQAIKSPSGSSIAQSLWYPEGGTSILSRGTFWLGVRCEPAGQGGRGGHEHNDRLSFELSVAGQDIVVDWGTGVYTADPETRNRFRSTFNHSTVAVEGLEQNPWKPGLLGLFSLPENCLAKCLEVSTGKFVGQHSGFGPIHRRSFLLGEESLIIEDTLDAPGPSAAILTLAPGISPQLDPEHRRVLLRRGSLTIAVEPEPAERPIEIVPGICSQGYGEFRDSHKVIVKRICARDALRLRLVSAGSNSA